MASQTKVQTATAFSHIAQIDNDFAFYDQDLPELWDNQGSGWMVMSQDGFWRLVWWTVWGQKVRVDNVPWGIVPVIFVKISSDTNTNGWDPVKILRPILS